MSDTIAWVNGDDYGRPTIYSRKHYISTDNPDVTRCGVRIPDKRDVVDMTDGYSHQPCRRCAVNKGGIKR